MKRIVSLILVLCLTLVGCAVPEHPDVAADGTTWGEDWTDIGAVLGVEPIEGWTSQRSEDLLADVGMYFASWTWGEPQRTIEGETSYRAQTFLVLSACETAADAWNLVSQWQSAAEDSYLLGEPRTLEHKNGTFTVREYTFREENASFDRGLIALAVVNDTAINVEITCNDDTGIDLNAALAEFLDACHFAS